MVWFIVCVLGGESIFARIDAADRIARTHESAQTDGTTTRHSGH